jgi:hypothetical protein
VVQTGALYKKYFSAVGNGILIFLPIYLIVSLIGNMFFWSDIIKIRRATGRIDTFGIMGEIIVTPKYVLMEICFNIITFGISAYITSRTASKHPLLQSLLLCCLLLILSLVLGGGWLEHPYLTLAKILIAFLASIIAALIGDRRSRKKWAQIV